MKRIKISHSNESQPNSFLEVTSVQSEMIPSLTENERNLLKFICEGKSSTEIGLALNKSHRTIEDHRTNLYKKFNVKSKEELIVLTTKFRLV
jgi:DNA-binding CsgD family transcriptional regulator